MGRVGWGGAVINCSRCCGPDKFFSRQNMGGGGSVATMSIGHKPLSIGHKHYNEQGLPATEAFVTASAWVPKEDWSSFSACVITALTVLEEQGCNLRTALRAIILDGAPAAAKALSILLPKVPLLRDLRHIMTNCKKLPASMPGEKINGTYLAAEVQWTSYLPSPLLFHFVWKQVLKYNVRRDMQKLNEYIESELLRFEAICCICESTVECMHGMTHTKLSHIHPTKHVLALRRKTNRVCLESHTRHCLISIQSNNLCLCTGRQMDMDSGVADWLACPYHRGTHCWHRFPGT